jgi:hypothetical protein
MTVRSNQHLYDILDDIADDFEKQGNFGVAEEVRNSKFGGATSTEIFGDIYKTLKSLRLAGCFEESSYEATVLEVLRILRKMGYK